MRRCACLLFCILATTSALAQEDRAFDVTRMDRAADPCQDFNQFANGNWEKTTEIPPAFSSWGSANILAENNRKVLHGILEESAKRRAAAGSNEQKVGDYYASCMDEAAVEAAGLKPLQPELDRIRALRNTNDLRAQIARMHRSGVPAVFSFASLPDLKDSNRVIGFAGQGGLSLPNRDYYTKTDDKSKEIREEFVRHVARMFQLLGESPEAAMADAKTVMAIQTRLAESSRTPVALRDPLTQYNLMAAPELAKLTPHFPWPDYFGAIGTAREQQVNMAHPEFFQAADRMLEDIPLGEWKAYLRWHLVTARATALPKRFVDENFAFFGKTLAGRKEQYPRWRVCVADTDQALGQALGQVYVARHFTPESKAQMKTMVDNLLAAFRARLQRLDWMGDATRVQALAKLDAIKEKIGYPEKWIDYSRLRVGSDGYFANAARVGEFAKARDLAKIGKPVDRTEWRMSPPTVNAGYASLQNEIIFPAGILQPPFFNAKADDAINYGAIGAVIGHEITHGFDDSGSRFDAAGNMRSWWSDEDRKRFDERAECVVDQFGAFDLGGGLRMTGKLVVGESIADLGGLYVAYDAWRRSLEGKPRPPEIAGFTPEQRFFLGWAQVWTTKYTPEAARLLATSGPHPLSRYRMNGPLANMPAFAQAFQCKAGDAMVRAGKEQCRVW